MLEAIEARLVATGRMMLDYLSERDLALEAERDRVLHQLLEDVATGMPAAERARMSARASELLERRRAARDAARWREAQGPGGVTHRVDVEALAERLRVDEPDPVVEVVPEPPRSQQQSPQEEEAHPPARTRSRRRARPKAAPEIEAAQVSQEISPAPEPFPPPEQDQDVGPEDVPLATFFPPEA